MNTAKTFRALGTVNRMTVFGCKDESPLVEAERLVTGFDDMWSVFKDTSEISRLNEAAGQAPVPVSKRTMELLSAARRFGALYGGAFCITIGPLSRLWKNAIASGAVPSEAEIEKARALVGDDGLILDETAGTAFLTRPGQQADLGSIAKGYAADCVRALFEAAGIREALINFGGTVTAMGRAYRVGIQHPRKPTGITMGSLPLKDASIVTSGDYERGFSSGGRRYHHLIDPTTGMPCESGLCSVSLIGRSAMELDALSTAVFVAGPEKGAGLVRQSGAEAIFVTDKLDIFCTDGLNGVFTLNGRAETGKEII